MARTRNRFNGIGVSLSDAETVAENYSCFYLSRI